MCYRDENNSTRYNSKCIRCWRKRPQVGGNWCFDCWREMHQIAKTNTDPHTCQGPECDCLTEPGKPLCSECEAFYMGAYHDVA